MENASSILNVIAPLLTIVLTVLTFYKSRKVEKMKQQTYQSQKRVEEIEKTVENVRGQLANNSRISKTSEMKEKTSQFHTLVKKYLKKPEDYIDLGYSIKDDHEEIRNFMSYLSENNWLFEEETDNYANNLYNDLFIFIQAFEEGSDEEIHNQSKLLVRKIEEFKSKVSKLQDSMLF
jgi:DNA repair ATPase RecN